MIIYQLHETSGEYEDYTDRIIGSYMRRKRVVEEKARREKEVVDKNSRIRHCMCCPYLNALYEDIGNKELIDKMTEYCDHSKITINEYGYAICSAYGGCIFDDREFYFETVEVEE